MSLKVLLAKQLAYHFPWAWQNMQMRRRPWQYEPELYLVRYFCPADATAIDVGSHGGVYAYEMSRGGAQVVLCEPNPNLMARLRVIFRGKAQFVPKALSDYVGIAQFRYSEFNLGNATIEAKNDLSSISPEHQVRTVEVPVTTLDSLVLSSVSFIKVDVEGHEEAVLRGGRQTILRDKPVIVVETENRHNEGAPRRVFALIQEMGYSVYFLRGRKLEEIAAIKSSDLSLDDALSSGKQYINNFVLIPLDRPKALDAVKIAVRNLPYRLAKP